MKHISIIIALSLVLAHSAAVAFAIKCSRDGTFLTFTGRTKVDWGKLYKECKCATGEHTYWLEDC